MDPGKSLSIMDIVTLGDQLGKTQNITVEHTEKAETPQSEDGASAS